MGDDILVDAFERLRLGCLTFRRAEAEEIREIEAMRFEVLKLQATGALHDAAASVALRLRLMERAFYVLRLVNFGNAPENRGWMNLFREWGRDFEFNARYQAMKQTLSPQFRSFYESYLFNYEETIEERPIHHPWQRHESDRGTGIFMDTGRTEAPTVPGSARPGAHGVDDAKGRAGVDQPYEHPSGGGTDDGGTPIPNA